MTPTRAERLMAAKSSRRQALRKSIRVGEKEGWGSVNFKAAYAAYIRADEKVRAIEAEGDP